MNGIGSCFHLAVVIETDFVIETAPRLLVLNSLLLCLFTVVLLLGWAHDACHLARLLHIDNTHTQSETTSHKLAT